MNHATLNDAIIAFASVKDVKKDKHNCDLAQIIEIESLHPEVREIYVKEWRVGPSRANRKRKEVVDVIEFQALEGGWFFTAEQAKSLSYLALNEIDMFNFRQVSGLISRQMMQKNDIGSLKPTVHMLTYEDLGLFQKGCHYINQISTNFTSAEAFLAGKEAYAEGVVSFLGAAPQADLDLKIGERVAELSRRALVWEGTLVPKADRVNFELTDKIVTAFGSFASPEVVRDLFDLCIYKARPDYLADRSCTLSERELGRRLRTLAAAKALVLGVPTGTDLIVAKSLRKIDGLHEVPKDSTGSIRIALRDLKKTLEERGHVYEPVKAGRRQKKVLSAQKTNG